MNKILFGFVISIILSIWLCTTIISKMQRPLLFIKKYRSNAFFQKSLSLIGFLANLSSIKDDDDCDDDDDDDEYFD